MRVGRSNPLRAQSKRARRDFSTDLRQLFGMNSNSKLTTLWRERDTVTEEVPGVSHDEAHMIWCQRAFSSGILPLAGHNCLTLPSPSPPPLPSPPTHYPASPLTSDSSTSLSCDDLDSAVLCLFLSNEWERSPQQARLTYPYHPRAFFPSLPANLPCSSVLTATTGFRKTQRICWPIVGIRTKVRPTVEMDDEDVRA